MTKVWWKCGLNHSWQAAIYSRASGVGCPYCAKELQTSFPEKAIYYYIQKHFQDAISGYRSDSLFGYELDIFIPSMRIGIEYDGERWHQNIANDLQKNIWCAQEGIYLLRVREPNCPILSDGLSCNIIMTNKRYGLKGAILNVYKELQALTAKDLPDDIDLSRDSTHILSLVSHTAKANNLYTASESLIKEWDCEKNHDLTPALFSIGSDKKVWWTCSKGHSYTASIASRVRGRNCPVCAGKKVLQGYNDFESKCPELAKQWDYQKNHCLPSEVAFGSDKKFWWNCANAHSYESSINNRRAGQGCPYCSGKKVLPGFNDILTTHPEIVKQWDYDSNILTPNTISAGSSKRVWWKCTICNYKWQAIVYNRCLKKSGCPHCSGRVKL